MSSVRSQITDFMLLYFSHVASDYTTELIEMFVNNSAFNAPEVNLKHANVGTVLGLYRNISGPPDGPFVLQLTVTLALFACKPGD